MLFEVRSLRIKRLKLLIKKSVVYRSIMVISRRDRFKVFAVIGLQISFGFLDLLGVAAIGILGALAVTGVGSGVKGNRVNAALDFLHISDQSFQFQVAALGSLAAILLIARTVFSVIFTRRMLLFLSNRGAVLSSDLIKKIFNRPLLEVTKRTSQETIYSISSGVNAITLGVIGVTVNLISDVSLLVVLGIGLFVVSPSIAFSTLIIFAAIAVVLYRISHVKAQQMGQLIADLNISGNEKIVEGLDTYRELFIRNRRSYYAEQISATRFKLSKASAELSFMPYVSKYVIETSMVIGALLISAIQFKLQNAVQAVATLSVFLAAGTRIVPAILRVQQGALSIKSSLGAAGPTLDHIEELVDFEPSSAILDEPVFSHNTFSPDVVLSNVSFAYPEKNSLAMDSVNLIIRPGQMVAFVGPSGGGKSTLIDLILGVLEPSQGSIKISGFAPLEAIERWPGAIGYVPQNVAIVKGSIRSNVELGYSPFPLFEEELKAGLKIAHLDKFVSNFPNGWDAQVGEGGSKLSGGERQRLGIARALFTKPRLVVLDEATSALDAETEKVISDSISKLRGENTVLVVAHRLSTVHLADIIHYIADGKVIASGNFDDLRERVKEFDEQAKLMGL